MYPFKLYVEGIGTARDLLRRIKKAIRPAIPTKTTPPTTPPAIAPTFNLWLVPETGLEVELVGVEVVEVVEVVELVA